MLTSDEPALMSTLVCAPTVPEAYTLAPDEFASAVDRARRVLFSYTVAIEESSGGHWDAFNHMWLKDPIGRRRSLLPVLFDNYRPRGIFSSIAAIDLNDLGPNEASARFIEQLADTIPECGNELSKQ